MTRDDEDGRLGLEVDITRRDFLNATLLGTGAALALAPSSARGQWPGISDEDAWYGPGGVGEFASSHGHTPEVVRVAHELRDRKYDRLPADLVDTGEVYDLVVVGGGFAGLSAAHEFLKGRRAGQSCLLLENHPMLGGEAKPNEFEVAGQPGELFLDLAPSSLWSVSAKGGEPVRLTEDGHLDHSPVFASDGAHLFFVSDRGGSRDVYRIGVKPSGEANGLPERLTTGLNVHSISLSAGDETLAYAVVSVRQNIWSLPIPAKGPVSVSAATPVTTGNQSSEGMNVSADGRWLVFDSTRGGNQHIFKMPLPSGEPVQLTRDSPSDCCPTWSPDGTRIAFDSFRTGNRDIFVMSADGGSVRQLTNDPAPDRYPAWSPDGKQIVFTSGRTPPQRFYLVSADKGELQGEQPRPVTSEASCCAAAWSSDGRWIAGGASDMLSLAPIAAEGGQVRTLRNLPPENAYPLWSPDARSLYYKEAGRGIWRIAVSGGEPELLVRFDDPERPPVRGEWATDGRRFYFTRTEYEGDLWVMELQ